MVCNSIWVIGDLPAEGFFAELDGALDVVRGDFEVNNGLWHRESFITQRRAGWGEIVSNPIAKP